MSTTGAYPVVVYLPNAPAPVSNPYLTNTSTFTLSYSYTEVEAFLDSANLNAKKGFPNPSDPLTADSEWPLCLKCATVERARERAGLNRTSACESCFTRCASCSFASYRTRKITDHFSSSDCWNDGISEILVNATETGQNNTPSGTSGASFLTTSTVGVASLLAFAFTLLA